MKLIPAGKAPIEHVEAFLKTAEHVSKENLLNEGYVVEIDQEIRGCFVLSTIDKDVYWLKQLYIAKEEAANLPVLLETILLMTKSKQAKKLYVHSHQPVVDILLDALQFNQQKAEKWSEKYSQTDGNWWAYHVS